jgi:hypothetical protein
MSLEKVIGPLQKFLMGLFPNTAFDPFVQNAAEPQVREATNSRAIWSFSNQDAGALWAQWGKAGIREQSPNVW